MFYIIVAVLLVSIVVLSAYIMGIVAANIMEKV